MFSWICHMNFILPLSNTKYLTYLYSWMSDWKWFRADLDETGTLCFIPYVDCCGFSDWSSDPADCEASRFWFMVSCVCHWLIWDWRELNWFCRTFCCSSLSMLIEMWKNNINKWVLIYFFVLFKIGEERKNNLVN